jgi:transcriptional regulator with XRE-family HTH domain
MFEIGSSLREARERRGLELPAVERATHIRVKYLAALENERFDVLPGPAYTKGFLRTYADFLGLDAQRFVDAYTARFPPEEETPTVTLARVRRRRSLLDSRLVVVAFAVLLGLIGWRLSSIESGHNAASPPPPPSVSHTRLSQPTAPLTPPRARPRTAGLVLRARGRCWISVRLGSEAGRRLYEGTLEPGTPVRFAAGRLWIRIGAPWNLEATLNGKPLLLPGTVGNIVVTPHGLQRVPM